MIIGVRYLHKLFAVMAIVAGITGAAAILVHAVGSSPEAQLSGGEAQASGKVSAAALQKAAIAEADLPATYPVRLSIPRIEVDAAIQRVGIAYSGRVGVPSNFTDAGWYKYGTVPGDEGVAIMDGHVDNALGLAGVFKRLVDLRAGDDIYVTRHDGTKLHFRVTGSQEYDHTVVSAEVFQGSGGAELRLITCDGVWDQEEKTYDKRVVVSAVMEEKIRN